MKFPDTMHLPGIREPWAKDRGCRDNWWLRSVSPSPHWLHFKFYFSTLLCIARSTTRREESWSAVRNASDPETVEVAPSRVGELRAIPSRVQKPTGRPMRGGGGVLPRLVVGLRVWVRLLLAVQAVLAASPVAVVLERAEVVAGSGLGAVPVVALGPLPPHEGGGGLREEVVLVLRVVVAAQAEDGLLDDVLPAALLGEVQGLLCRAEGKLHEHVGGHGVRTGHPSH